MYHPFSPSGCSGVIINSVTGGLWSVVSIRTAWPQYPLFEELPSLPFHIYCLLRVVPSSLSFMPKSSRNSLPSDGSIRSACQGIAASTTDPSPLGNIRLTRLIGSCCVVLYQRQYCLP